MAIYGQEFYFRNFAANNYYAFDEEIYSTFFSKWQCFRCCSILRQEILPAVPILHHHYTHLRNDQPKYARWTSLVRLRESSGLLRKVLVDVVAADWELVAEPMLRWRVVRRSRTTVGFEQQLPQRKICGVFRQERKGLDSTYSHRYWSGSTRSYAAQHMELGFWRGIYPLSNRSVLLFPVPIPLRHLQTRRPREQLAGAPSRPLHISCNAVRSDRHTQQRVGSQLFLLRFGTQPAEPTCHGVHPVRAHRSGYGDHRRIPIRQALIDQYTVNY
ncbi:unnamed protein product [Sphagnum jensenii]